MLSNNTDNKELRFGDVVLAHCVLNMFSSGWLLGFYIDEKTITSVMDIDDEHPEKKLNRGWFDKCDKFIKIDENRPEIKKILKNEMSREELAEWWNTHKNIGNEEAIRINEPFQVIS